MKLNLRILRITLVSIILFFIFYGSREGFTVNHDPILMDLKRQMAIIDPTFRDIQLAEGDKSYTINKQHVYLCLKDSNGRYYDRNMLIYVLCHEYAHTLCDEVGHTPKFYTIFQDMLNKATIVGIYNPNIPPLKNYCGHKM